MKDAGPSASHVLGSAQAIGISLNAFGVGRGEYLTTGDPCIDSMLGGGIRPGMVWELIGERYQSFIFFHFPFLNPL